MNVLLSAYACEPNQGSEPGVGWNCTLEVVKLGFEVWVITRTNNKKAIEHYFSQHVKPKNLNFIYYDVPRIFSWWKKGGRGIYLYYLLWQIGAFFKAKQQHRSIGFNLVQHLTFVSIKQPSFMGFLNIPFIFGPVGGGESAPFALRKSYSKKGYIKDIVRDMVNFFVKFDPLMHSTFHKSHQIFVTSNQTKDLVPKFYHNKVSTQLAIGYESGFTYSEIIKPNRTNTSSLKVLYVGRFEYWKGMALGIKAFKKLIDSGINATLTMVGKGQDKHAWVELAQSMGISEHINWIEWVNQEELSEVYKTHDVFLFPSLHDSGGMVVLEAMSYGVPVICLNIGGPGAIVDDTCGIKINVTNKNESNVINQLFVALNRLYLNPIELAGLSKGAVLKSQQNSWGSVVRSVYKKELSLNENINPS